MIIRKATKADVPALNYLVNGAYRGEGSKRGWTTEAELLDGIRTTETALHKMLHNPQVFILVGEIEEDLVACVYLEKQNAALYLGMLTVRPDMQGAGLGARMMHAAEETAHDLGCSLIRMTVITARKELIAYYQRKGFSDTGERQPFPDDPAFGIPKQPLQFLVMEKTLQK